MKAILSFATAALLGTNLAFAQVAPQVAIFKRLETITTKNESEQTTPPAGQAVLNTKFTEESWEILDLTGNQHVIVQVYPTLRKFVINSASSGIIYNTMRQKLPGTFLWFRSEGESTQAEFLNPNTSNTELGYDYFPDATTTTPAGDGVADYFSTFHVVRNESGKSAPLIVKTGLVSATLNVPRTIAIAGGISEQNEDTEALGRTGKGDRGMSASILSGTVALDLALTTKANTVTTVGQTLGSLSYGQELVRLALVARGFSPL
jgi:hypothetical protein